MDFINGLQKSTRKNDAIMVVVDKFNKSAHFIPVKSNCKEIDIANIFMKEIFGLHGMPKEIVSKRDTKFTSRFWKSLMAGFVIQVDIDGHPHVPTGSSCLFLVQHVLLYFFVIVGSTLLRLFEALHIFQVNICGVSLNPTSFFCMFSC